MPAVSTHAVTVLGHDRPGIIAAVTERLAGLGLNLEDSTMTLLRGHFAMTLVCAGAATAGDVEHALAPLTGDGTLSVTVHDLPADDGTTRPGSPYLLTVHGGDRPGIVSALVAEVARVGGNITDLTTRLAGDLYVLVAELDLPDGVDVPALEGAVGTVAATLGVGATLRPADADEL